MTHTPIILAAFGTTSRAMETYTTMDGAIKDAFPGHPVIWSYTSRMVRDHLKKKKDMVLNTPQQALDNLVGEGHHWAVMQSLHLICGHEFYRLVDDIRDCKVRASMGLPLLTSPEDYQSVAHALIHTYGRSEDRTATVFVGHGTDHPAWTTYPALARLVEKNDPAMYVGTVEEGEDDREAILSDILKKGYTHVRLVPLMLVAGVHLREDIAGDRDSWKSLFQDHGLQVSYESIGMGQSKAILAIFISHIKDALSLIP